MSRISFFWASVCFLSSFRCATRATEHASTTMAEIVDTFDILDISERASPRRFTTITTLLQVEANASERSIIGPGVDQVKPFYRRHFSLRSPCYDGRSEGPVSATRRQHRDRARRWCRRTAAPADEGARQTGRLLRRPVSHHRLRAQQLHQLRPAAHLHRDPI